LIFGQTVNLSSTAGTSKTVSTTNTTHAVSDNNTYYFNVSYSGDTNSIGRKSVCVESIAATLTGDSGPGTAP
jgi:hypothetical protein